MITTTDKPEPRLVAGSLDDFRQLFDLRPDFLDPALLYLKRRTVQDRRWRLPYFCEGSGEPEVLTEKSDVRYNRTMRKECFFSRRWAGLP